ncbi:hypothetical protein H5U35_00825 [Candidatus Aerophobetes bacterium]|nr:hypothetical protein [Candidatus Aerophobetes bacterium]
MLPRMSMGNWLFWSILCWVFFNLAWLKFVERFVPQWIGAIVATFIAIVVFKFGPRPSEEEEEEEEE